MSEHQGTCTCDVCGRVLWVEDGPVCVDCLLAKAQRDAAKDGKLPQQDVEPKPAPKKRSGCCG